MKSIHIFDADGVITNPYTKTPNPTVLAFISAELKNNQPVGILTGRSVEWVEQKILSFIPASDLLFISGEKGGVNMTFEHGEKHLHIDPSIHFPMEIKQEMETEISKYPDIFIDEDKHTMVSLEMKGGDNQEYLAQQQKQLDELEHWIEKTMLPSFPTITVERTQIALDIQEKHVTKRLATDAFLQFVSSKNIATEEFLMFGDNPTDIVVTEELVDQGKKAGFIYVGEKQFEHAYPFPVYKTTALYDLGVIEFLKKT